MDREETAPAALYRQWRPQTFAEVVGQEHVTRTLRNALLKNRVAHALLFAGPRGTGKTSTARILAKALNCVHGPTAGPCNACHHCRAITAGTALDVLELDAASRRGIDEMRELRERVKLAPVAAPYKVYIIDEAHMLTTEAANALLKTLEEPPPRVVFILATTEPRKVPVTILSRCQRFDFHRLQPAEIRSHLQQVLEKVEGRATPAAIDLISQAAEGSMRDALGILDQVLSLGDGDADEDTVADLLGKVRLGALTKMVELLRHQDAAGALRLVLEMDRIGKDPGLFVRDLLALLREDLLQTVDQGKTVPCYLMCCLEEFSRALEETKGAVIRTLPLELAIVRALRRSAPAETQPVESTVGDNEGGTSLQQVKTAWVDILKAVKSSRPVTFGYLSRARPVAVSGRCLKVSLPDAASRGVLAQQEHSTVVEQALSKFFGDRWKLEVGS
ncbi:MAG TPA: DNA polymerase III subunit gamma/tau [Desulfotomaculum sp.]|nr:DNA polymerase III subunit gamma/tau [Desulfotomaculum sp.]